MSRLSGLSWCDLDLRLLLLLLLLMGRSLYLGLLLIKRVLLRCFDRCRSRAYFGRYLSWALLPSLPTNCHSLSLLQSRHRWVSILTRASLSGMHGLGPVLGRGIRRDQSRLLLLPLPLGDLRLNLNGLVRGLRFRASSSHFSKV